MKSHTFKLVRALAATLLAASLATPLTVWADDDGSRDSRARAQAQAQAQSKQAQAAQQAQQAKERERAELAKREQAKREQARHQQEQQARAKVTREQQAKQDAERKDTRVLRALDETRDNQKSDHPSGKDRNDERGSSFPQGNSRSNPDGGGLDKPFGVDSKLAGSQGRGDFDGNNGCGNDNDFADDNNGNCGGRRVAAGQAAQAAQSDKDKPKTEVAGVQVKADDKKVDAKKDEHRANANANANADANANANNDHQVKSDQRHQNDDADNRNHEKVGVCHATRSATNPFVFIQVSKSGAEHGHEGHAGDKIGVASANDCPKIEVAGAQVERTDAAHHRVKADRWHWLRLFLERCREVLGISDAKHKDKPEVAGTQVEQPTKVPTAVPANTPKPTQVSGTNAATGHECVPTEWHWVMTQVNDINDSPEKISVTWANGQALEVPRTAYTGKVAHYATTLNLNSAVVNATTVAPAGWSGQFNLSHGPCIYFDSSLDG